VDQCRLHELVVGSEELIPPDDLARYATAVGDALTAVGVGSVGASARMTEEPNEWGMRSMILVSVSDLEAGVRVLRHALRAAQVPDATWIYQFQPELIAYEIWGFSDQDPPKWGW
jgi:hypothetical protein